MKILQDGFISFEADEQTAALTSLGWDTEGTGRAGVSFLKSPVRLLFTKNGRALTPAASFFSPNDSTVRYAFEFGNRGRAIWEICGSPRGLSMKVSFTDGAVDHADRMELVFPFDPAVAVASVISETWTEKGNFRLPAVVSVPDLGQMRVACREFPEAEGRIEGSRREKWITATLELPVPDRSTEIHLDFTPVVLPLPKGFDDERRWRLARRGWFNLIQLSCGASGGGADAAGVWANNTLSDPVSSLVYMLGEATLLVPELAPGVGMPPILRRTLEYWMDCKTNRDGLVTYTARGIAGSGETDDPNVNPTYNQNVMDANPSILIGAWCYIRATQDLEWLLNYIEKLELLSLFMEKRDIDGDGLIESRQSGNAGSRPPRNPDCAWDCYCSGHKNAYVNALAYRAWLGLADLEKQLGRAERRQRYAELAGKLKASFLPTFYHPETGWLGSWRSRDGKLHDIHTDTPASFALAYGLVDKHKGREMLLKYWQALEESGFQRFDLGVPLNLRPVPREEMEEYSAFQQFLNGGCSIINTTWLLDALYIAGMDPQADGILDAMLSRQAEGAFPNGGGFQNGFVDKMGRGAEVLDWNGNPAGYEGHLVYCWGFLQAMLRGRPALRERVYGLLLRG